MKIAIDCRFWGLTNAGLGRYAMSLVKQLEKIDKKNRYYILLTQKYYKELKLAKNFEKVLADVAHYSVKEQLLIPQILRKINPDITHFLHFINSF